MSLANDILRDADRCVKCGLCAPHCPTYGKTQDENDSPRGRVALMQGLASGQLPPEGKLIMHLDRCLACRACEHVCPSGVAYGRLLDETRALLAERRPPPRRVRLALDGLVTQRKRLRAVGTLLRIYQRSGLQRLARASRLLRVLGLETAEAQLPRLPPSTRWQPYYAPAGATRGRVALFLGCVAELADSPTLLAAIRVLNRLGYGVLVPAAQGCCGALHQHSGAAAQARALAAANVRAFADLDVNAIVYTASGCGAQLAEYAQLAWEDPALAEQARRLGQSVMDISQFLAQIDWPDDLDIAPLAAQVAVHDPCSLTHVLRQPHAPYQLLRRIPGLRVAALPDNARCCGAAGSYMLTQPEMAAALRADKLAALDTLRPDYLATSNLGCALHLAAGLRAAGSPVEVVHPVVLLDRQMDHGSDA